MAARFLVMLLALAVWAAALTPPSASAAEWAWIEAEGPAKVADGLPARRHLPGPAERVSGQVLQIEIPAEKTAEVLGAGKDITYEFTLKAGGKHELWARLALEFVRSPFSWRLDDGEWHAVSANREEKDLATDLMEIAFWYELGWLRLGAPELAAGKHALTLRFAPPKEMKDGKEVPARVACAFDAFCLYQGQWAPNGPHRPDAPAAPAAAPLEAAPAAGQAVAVSLNGEGWRFARWDENGKVADETRLQPARELPALDKLHWRPFRVPGARDDQLADASFAHRYLLRRQVKLPGDFGGRAVRLNLENFGMLVSVFVNGRFCGWSKNHNTRFVCDVTPAVRPGLNDVVLVFKDAYYAIAAADQPFGARNFFNLPGGMLGNQGISFRFDMPIAWDRRTGIYDGASLDFAAGEVWAEDVFVKPSVSARKLATEVTLVNSGAAPCKVTVRGAVFPCDANGKAAASPAKELPPVSAEVAPGAAATLRADDAWADAVLWWPDAPQLYELVTTVEGPGGVSDRRATRFGFREWGWKSGMFTLNGIDWPMWADTQDAHVGDRAAHQRWRREVGGRMARLWRPDGRRAYLDFCDLNGFPVRASGVFDGETAAYGLREKGPDGKLVAKPALFRNWQEQLLAQVREERNHPSVFIWSIENEVTYINSRNLGQSKEVEPAIRAVAAKVEALDPTRPTMVDGGNALLDQSMPVNGVHYGETFRNPWRNWPDGFYSNDCFFTEPKTDRWQIWPMAEGRPVFHGEIFFANGISPSAFAQLGGEECFAGIAWTDRARALFYRMNSEGYRWNGTAAWHYWNNGPQDKSYVHSWREVAVLCRQWNWTFGAGEKVTRTLRLFNSTRHAGPIRVHCALVVDGKEVEPFDQEFSPAPGKWSEFTAGFTAPALGQDAAAVYRLRAERAGKEVFFEEKPVRLLAARPAPRFAAGGLAVLDPAGDVRAYLEKRQVPFAAAANLAELAASPAKVVVVGRDAVAEADCANPEWKRLAFAGKRLVVLEQRFPLRYQALEADLEPTDHDGRVAFFEDPSHPAANGLVNADLFCWGNDHVNYRHSYRKATRGVRSLIQCDEQLGDCALAESQVGKGLQILCQMAVGEKLASNAVAGRLFDNLLARAAAYVHVVRPVTLCAAEGSRWPRAFGDIGLRFASVRDPLATLAKEKGVALVEATPANLAALAGAAAKVRAFAEHGGWLMLLNATPEGLADLNRLTGVRQIMRPFAAERVAIAIPRDPLASGLTLRDVALYTGKSLVGFMHVDEPVKDLFTYVVDYDEVGGFAKLPRPTELGKPSDTAPGVDHRPENLTNGFTADDFWTFAYMINLDRGDATRIPFTFPREETFTGFSIILNVIYHKATKLHLYFDDDPNPVVLPARPTHDRQDFSFPGRKASKVTLEIAGWEKSGKANVAGIDNVWFKVERSDAFRRQVRPLFTVPGIVRYPMGAGGIVLNQVCLQETESNPVNAEKKLNIVRTVLRNLDAAFAGGGAVMAGEGLAYAPAEFAPEQFTAYLTHQGTPPWYAGPGDLSHLPTGRQKLGDVVYHIADFKTSPVPGAAMLRGHGAGARAEKVTGIKIGRRADALFFLHACNPDPKELARLDRDKPALWRYVVHYADGKTAEVPVRWGEDVGAWDVAAARPLKNAVVAWQGAFPKDASRRAALYTFQWNNPRPQAAIESVDFVEGPDHGRLASPALLAITAGSAAKINF